MVNVASPAPRAAGGWKATQDPRDEQEAPDVLDRTARQEPPVVKASQENVDRKVHFCFGSLFVRTKQTSL